MLFTVGRVCIKLAGRDAGKYCVIVESVDNNYVIVDGQTRRRKCNVLHLDPTKKTVEIKAKASSEEVKSALEAEGIMISEKGSSRNPADKPKKAKIQHKQAKK